MNIFWSFIVIALVMGFTESCMRTVPPDDAYIPVTSAPGETEMPGEMLTTIAMEVTTEKVCEATSTATCPDLANFFISPTEIIQQDGCPYLKCQGSKLPTPLSAYDVTEIPPPDASYETTAFNINPPTTDAELGGSFINYFGIICDGTDWKITKYPNGIAYQVAGNFVTVGDDGSFDGKKTMLGAIQCL